MNRIIVLVSNFVWEQICWHIYAIFLSSNSMICKIKQPNFVPFVIEVNTTFFGSNIKWPVVVLVFQCFWNSCLDFQTHSRHCVSIHHFSLSWTMTYQPTAHDCPLCQLWMWCVVVGPSAHLKENSCAEQLKGTAPAAAFLKWRDGSRPSDLLVTGWSLVKSTTGKVWSCVEVGDCVSYGPLSKVLVRHCKSGTEAFWALCCHQGSVDCIVFMSSWAFFFA